MPLACHGGSKRRKPSLIAYALAFHGLLITQSKRFTLTLIRLRNILMLWNLIRLASSPVTCHWHVTPQRGRL